MTLLVVNVRWAWRVPANSRSLSRGMVALRPAARHSAAHSPQKSLSARGLGPPRPRGFGGLAAARRRANNRRLESAAGPSQKTRGKRGANEYPVPKIMKPWVLGNPEELTLVDVDGGPLPVPLHPGPMPVTTGPNG